MSRVRILLQCRQPLLSGQRWYRSLQSVVSCPGSASSSSSSSISHSSCNRSATLLSQFSAFQSFRFCSSGSSAVQGFANQESASVGFEDLGLDSRSLRAVQEVFRYQQPSDVQVQALKSLVGSEQDIVDAVLHAKTGTGKTLAFLIPALEQVLRHRPPGVGALVIAPSRELVLQITREAELLLSYHSLQVVPLVSGTRRDRDEANIRKRRPAIIVSTPGRVLDHLEGTFRFPSLLETLSTLVLDECDRLMDSFADDLRAILRYLPRKEQRQTILSSATIPDSVRNLAAQVCRPGYAMIDCVGKGVPTQDSVDQFYVVTPGMLALTALRTIIADEADMKPTEYKVIVFFPSARLAMFVANIFRARLKMEIHELHSRCDFASRIVTQQEFHAASAGVLFTTEVSERGLDFPNVSLVVQLFAPLSRGQYIHRVGRTARCGKTGIALSLFLDREVEHGCLAALEDLPLLPHPEGRRFLNDESGALMVEMSNSELEIASAAFASMLKHYRELHTTFRFAPQETVEAVSEIFFGCGVAELPEVSAALVKELGLESCADLRIAGADRRTTLRAISPEKPSGAKLRAQ